MDEKTLHVTVKNVYGNRLVYPACEASKIFARISGKTTLTDSTLYEIRLLGYRIEVDRPEL